MIIGSRCDVAMELRRVYIAGCEKDEVDLMLCFNVIPFFFEQQPRAILIHDRITFTSRHLHEIGREAVCPD